VESRGFHTQSVFQIQISMKLLLLLLPLATAVPIKIISYSATEEKHNHEMEGVAGEAVMGEFSFKAPDTGDAVYKLTYTADMDGFQAMGDHLPVPVIMDPVPEPELPAMVGYTPEVAAARAEFLRAQEEIMARHAAEEAENMVDEEVMEVEDMRRRRREADPVVIPTHANILPTTYHHLAGAYPVYQASVYNPYLSYPLHQVRAPILSHPVYTAAGGSYQYPIYRVIPQVATDVSATVEEGDDEPAALAL